MKEETVSGEDVRGNIDGKEKGLVVRSVPSLPSPLPVQL